MFSNSTFACVLGRSWGTKIDEMWLCIGLLAMLTCQTQGATSCSSYLMICELEAHFLPSRWFYGVFSFKSTCCFVFKLTVNSKESTLYSAFRWVSLADYLEGVSSNRFQWTPWINSASNNWDNSWDDFISFLILGLCYLTYKEYKNFLYASKIYGILHMY